ncbi:hypothetical protein FC70_GL000523 [Paucilactobacillus oligofermentans DSM 15707 = LMG 22743]|uniref:Iron-sulfur cluster biosynthesis protein n=1 Tax=Paucilactobacillus oligofermentans DSM 15707 = LMG 22743 TaxID=1423778 RepID=A0A0R1RPA4_9LACO|nr:hypothetical protein [Paucilactobacillus oligofermentans]KRL55938.1 hypothetical protein FC70_GL000523 [Paucilactobacillus oligofermentans DSM 15707 = LMG 22743]CUS26080.1 HesB-like protein [Paucilactobacillus oligofermentans DSM 15707 = LMG 22743]
MKITVTKQASNWFHNEMGLKSGNGVRFFGKVYGKTPVHDGFSIGMARDDRALHASSTTEYDGVRYFVDGLDDWFFKGYDLTVDYDEKTDGPKYEYINNGELK